MPRITITLVLIAGLSVCAAPGRGACPPSAAEHRVQSVMFGYALSKKPDPLIGMGPQIAATHDRLLEDQYRYALYLSDNRRFARQFIDGFPTDIQGFLSFGCGMTAPPAGSLERSLQIYHTLIAFAMAGDEEAIKKSLLVPTDGAIAEEMTDWVTVVASTHPHKSLYYLKTFSDRQRIRVMCFNLDDYYDKKQFDSFLATAPTSASEASVLADLKYIHRNCSSFEKQAE